MQIRRGRWVVALVAVVAVLVAACADRVTPHALPSGEDLYQPPDPVPDADAGSLLVFERMDSTVPNSRAWRIQYVSRSLDDDPVAVSGMVVAPARPWPPGGFPVVAWAHPTTGAGDACAPSKKDLNSIIGVNELVDAGFVVAATDYEGLGTPGPHPFLVGRSEARSVIDAVRAADDLPGVATSEATSFWGYSQGGHAVLFAAQEAADYAPELDVRGTAAAAPAASMLRLLGGAAGVARLPQVTFLIAGTWAATYDLDPASVLGEAAVDQLPEIERECSVGRLLERSSSFEVLRRSVLTVDPWPDLVGENTPGREEVTGPVLLIQGGADELITPRETRHLFERLCGHDVVTQLQEEPGATHDVAWGVIDQVVRWIEQRHAGEPPQDDCTGNG